VWIGINFFPPPAGTLGWSGLGPGLAALAAAAVLGVAAVFVFILTEAVSSRKREQAVESTRVDHAA
jgi:hypothetical protein